MSELKDLTPIKVVDNMKNLCALQRQVILGDGCSSAVVAIPHVNSKKHPAKKVWRVLLDSGSEGDIAFRHVGHRSSTFIPYKERFAPQRWRTSNGIFETTKVGKLEVSFPDYSSSKRISLQPDIVDVRVEDDEPIYDLILGVETMAKLGIVLNFQIVQLLSTIKNCQ